MIRGAFPPFSPPQVLPFPPRFPALIRSLCSLLAVWSAHFATATPGTQESLQTLPRLEVSDRLEIPPSRLTQRQADFFGIYEHHGGRKIGWMSVSRQPSTHDGRPSIRIIHHSEFLVSVEGHPVRNTTVEEYHFSAAAPHALLGARCAETLKHFRKSIVLRPKSLGAWQAEITEGRERRTVTAAKVDLHLSDLLSPALWAADPSRRTGDCFSTAAFDFQDLTGYAQRHKFLGPSHAPDAAEGWLEFETEDTRDHCRSRFTCDADGTVRWALIAGATERRGEPEAHARSLPQPTDLFADSVVPIDLPLGEPNATISSIKVRLCGPDVTGIASTALQKVETAPDGKSAVIAVGRTAGRPVAATAEEMAVHLKATPLLPIGDPRIQALARSAIADARTPLEKVQRLLAKVDAFIVNDATATPLSLFDLLRIRRGDCTEHALLFNALARASGIPCREVTGYLYLGDQRRAFGGHAWCEVVLDGHWHAVDPTWNQFDLDAAHIHLASGPATPRMAQFLSGGLSMERLDLVRIPRRK